jgi:hypothetical protein
MGITAVYNRHRYANEKRVALDASSRRSNGSSVATKPR